MTQLLLRLAGVLVVTIVLLLWVMSALGKILPNAGQILYSVYSMDSALLYSLDVNRRLSVQLADNLITNSPLLPSPDGQYIAFIGLNDLLTGNLVIINIDGTPLTHFDNITSDDGVGWLSDSQHLIFVPRLNGEITLLNVIDQSRTVQDLPPIEGWQNFSTSPDGQYLAFDRPALRCYNMYILRWRENESTCLPLFAQAAWSPDNEILLLQTGRNTILTADWEEFIGRDFFQMDDPPPSFSIDLDHVYQIGWSPDSRWLIVTGNSSSDLFLVDLAADNPTPLNLTNTPRVYESFPAWSPDGKQLVFIAFQDNNREIYIVNVDGTNIRRITYNDESEYNLTWLP